MQFLNAFTGQVEEYRHQEKPYEHQDLELEASIEERGWALFWEMGTGKSKPTIDKAAILYLQGEIDGVLVIAPNGVHRNWIKNELPRHMPAVVKWNGLAWDSGRSDTRDQRVSEQKMLGGVYGYGGLAIVAMTYEGISTNDGKRFAKKFFQKRRCMLVIDEAHRIKTPGAARSRVVLAFAEQAAYVAPLTGTPVANKPFDVYNIMRMVDTNFWLKHGIPNYTIFKQEFANFATINPKEGRAFTKVIGYKNLERLQDIIKTKSSRVLKEDVLDLPPKVYTQIEVEMTREQRRLYDELRLKYMVALENGDEVQAPHAMTRLLRLQQIACGYTVVAPAPLPDGTASEPRVVPLFELGENPRVRALEDRLDDVPHQAIVWARFQHDITQICHQLGNKAVRYDGMVPEGQRRVNLDRFMRGEAQFFVGNPAAAGTGLTLVNAKSEFYYSNSFNLVDRLQSEDRIHRIGQTVSVSIVDMVTPRSVDAKIVKALVSKFDVASLVMGDGLREWLEEAS